MAFFASEREIQRSEASVSGQLEDTKEGRGIGKVWGQTKYRFHNGGKGCYHTLNQGDRMKYYFVVIESEL